MAEAYEIAASRQIDDSETPGAETTWHVVGATSYANARATLDAAIPTTFTFPSGAIAYLDKIDGRELRDDEEMWEFSLTYNSQPEPETDDEEFEFDIPALNDRIFRAVSTSSYAPASKTAPDFGGAIGVSFGQLQPRGVEPYPPKSTFSITKYWAVANVDLAYQATLEAAVGSINSALFYGRASGTVRFLGARGRRSGNKFPISYEFGFRPANGAYTLNGISVAASYGWDVHDVYYAPEPDTTAKQPVWKPRAVYVHRIHSAIDLNSIL